MTTKSPVKRQQQDTLFSSSPSVSESRKRQSKRDEAIRRKLENDLSKKKAGKSSTKKGQNSGKKNRNASSPGTVLSLSPSEPVVCKPSATVYEAAQLMSAKRENCILVVDYDDDTNLEDDSSISGALLGIFTAKDLAFRVVGTGLKASSVTIDQIMTPHPLCATSDTLASDALNLMVERGFRHLPVIDEDTHAIISVLDITKCYQEAMEKLERMYEHSKKLHDAFNSISNEIGGLSGGSQPFEVVKYFEHMKSVMNGPTLESVLHDETTVPSYVNVKTSVHEAALTMKDNHTTAVLVKNEVNEVSGIFTSKDVVLRVIAAGLDPKTVSVIRVMTPQPDVAPKTLSIQQALRKMFEGHYLNLPVVDDGEIVGIVEVLKLTYATLSQINLISDAESHNSQSQRSSVPTTPSKNAAPGPAWNKFWNGFDLMNDSSSVHSESVFSNGPPEISQTELNQFQLDNGMHLNDSVSFVNGETSSLMGSSHITSQEDIRTCLHSFKFKTLTNNKTHRVSLRPIEGVSKLVELIGEKLGGSDDVEILYVDDENDLVSITHDQDLIDCVLVHKNMNLDKIDLLVHYRYETVPQDAVNRLIQNRFKKNVPSHPKPSNQLIPGIPNETLLPAVIVALGASIAVIFSLSRKH
ncbi:uncharacterized protein KLLA0_A02893g [Kluyveromyces lactis]|uniref:KLLA0A02893p n=1 Tax=Kluyveromyces lactis (strain ATCC 8585 / CBS 2359 / DSM 70799 / NBRC 1267 / NRRL Y-1140 / WM37) TaxID=284590 RepID=Q6CY63_KLULA|nr:uncharacterized protein KLLA0_A02893g [Kluyveromyces lactis]CAH02714.1 KLLA0A02893p [Kluyveromyces lactis]|eukprot:XP_451126.1 uncharacterized protein KLLA0_A02893g [Kluyveromyces lactis]